MRTSEDYRCQNGEIISNEEVKISFHETGEYGCIMSFWKPSEFVDILKNKWNPSQIVTLNETFDNIQQNKIIYNSDFIIWGKI